MTTTTLVCPTCGAATVEGDVFCEACGADLGLSAPSATTSARDAVACPACGAAVPANGDGYCTQCGSRLPAARDHTEVALDGAAAVSDRGKVHHRNEDAYALAAADTVLAVVCDGVSTTANPDAASQAAASAALAVLTGADAAPAQRLIDAFGAASAAVRAVDASGMGPSEGWPSCTFLAAIVDGATVDLASMGDCRSYWLPEQGDAEVLTADDSWAAEQIQAGRLSADEAYAQAEAHTITRWLGRDADDAWRPHLLQFNAPAAGRVLLCSDGLWNYAETPAAIASAAVGDDTSLIATARRLTDFALDAGGHDNITVVVVDVPHRVGANDAPTGKGSS